MTLSAAAFLWPQRWRSAALAQRWLNIRKRRAHSVCDSVALLAPPCHRLGIEVLEVKFMGSGRRLRRIYRVPACPRHRGVYACGSAPQAAPAGKAPVGSATPCSAPPKARRRTERRSYATDTCACTSGATGAASHGKHPTPGRGAAAARHRRETKRWRTTSIDRCASART